MIIKEFVWNNNGTNRQDFINMAKEGYYFTLSDDELKIWLEETFYYKGLAPNIILHKGDKIRYTTSPAYKMVAKVKY